MNVYDFDETIYEGDSTRDFSFYLLRKHPSLVRFLPGQARAFLRYANGELTKTQFKESYYRMFSGVPDMDEAVRSFWDRHEDRIKDFYFRQQRPDDLIISASPRFLLWPICERLGITHLIGSEVDASCGLYEGENCYGSEKVRRFLAAGYDPDAVESFYSDSCSDFPLAELAESAHIIRGEEIGPWERPVKYGMSAFFHHFNDRGFLIGLILGLVQFVGTLALTLLSSLWMPILAAFVTGFAFSMGLVFVLNSRLRKPLLLHPSEQVKSIIIPHIPGFVVQILSLLVMRYLLRLPKSLSIVAATLLGLPVTYISLRFRHMTTDKKETLS